MTVVSRLLASVVLTAGLAVPVLAAPIVVETPALSPLQQQLKFRLPPGFEIQLVAAEPDIGKPMNMNFDARGRLWISHSLEYPFPTAGEGVQPRDLNQDMITDHAPRDQLSYFEAIGPDGRGLGLTHFAEGLNIPIGELPVVWSASETAALGYSIPALRLYQRAGGEGLADFSKVLIKGFGNVDTHGMCSSLTRGFDGWVYACHGFRNTSQLDWGQGQTLTLNSGNTFRFRPDGSAVEQFTWGQVNPFGMTFDVWGNLYNADCHSMPVTCLIRGATYQSFGKPDRGLGFGPDMIDHNHGSTGICGVAWYDSAEFPAEYRDCLYICNPVNGQVHRDRLDWQGSSPKVKSQPEFVTCDDGWFRPVDVKLGPDGALYIADFYNAIIGHYEAPLQHPLRDRTHARIWRVVYTGTKESRQRPREIPDLTALDDAALVARLGDANFATRMLATNLVVDRVTRPIASRLPQDAPENRGALLSLLEARLNSAEATPEELIHAGWAWSRLLAGSNPDAPALISRLAAHASPVVRTHAARILGATDVPALASQRRAVLSRLLKDQDARVRRGAAEALALQPRDAELTGLLAAFDSALPTDDHLRYAVRVALRAKVLQSGDDIPAYAQLPLSQQVVLAGIANSISPAPPAYAAWLRELVLKQAGDASGIPRREWQSWLKPAARMSDGQDFDALLAVAEQGAGGDLQEQVTVARQLLAGRQAEGLAIPPSLTAWAERLAVELLGKTRAVQNRWTYYPLPGERRRKSPFGMQLRQLAGQQGRTSLISSFPGGEDETGLNRSPAFLIPGEIRFWLCGHNGFPNTPDRRVNLIRLVDACTGAVLRQEYPPRHDVAREVVWQTAEWAGKSGFIEIVDGNDESAYAWIAAGQFSIEALNPPAFDTGAMAVALVKDFRLVGLTARLESMLEVDDNTLRSHAAAGLAALHPDARVNAILLWADEPETPAAAQSLLWGAVRTRSPDSLAKALRELLVGAPTDRQRKVADALVSDRQGAELLLVLASEGRLAPQLLQQPAMAFKIAALKVPELSEQLAAMTKSLPAPDVAMTRLLAARKASFRPETCSPEKGKAAFIRRCAVCHQIGTEGAKIGPQLDGVGIRGVDRLLEDVLDPNRNVDAAFRSSAIALTDGRILTGLKRREEGVDVVFANSEGKEFRVPSAEIEELRLSPTSLMPANFGESIPADEFADLLAWLLTQRPADRRDIR